MQPPADNPAAGSAAVNRIGQGVNPNILATPRACYPWPGRQSAQEIRLQPPGGSAAAANRIGQGVNPNILATPAGVNLHGARQSAQGIRLQPPLITPPPSIRTSWQPRQPRQPRGRAIPGQGVNQRKESGCNPPLITPPPDPPPSIG